MKGKKKGKFFFIFLIFPRVRERLLSARVREKKKGRTDCERREGKNKGKRREGGWNKGMKEQRNEGMDERMKKEVEKD